MPSAGALPAPFITPIHDNCRANNIPANKIDSNTLIELSTDSPNCKLYFTTDGTKPLPFQRKIAGKERTFKYFAPFTLKEGKRTLKAVSVSRDGLLESAVVVKTFNVVSDYDALGAGTQSEYETDTSSRSGALGSFIDESHAEAHLKPGRISVEKPKRSKDSTNLTT